MLLCEGDACPIKWFHFDCIGSYSVLHFPGFGLTVMVSSFYSYRLRYFRFCSYSSFGCSTTLANVVNKHFQRRTFSFQWFR